MADAWVRAMRAGDWAQAWTLEDRARAGRDPATRDDPALPYHRRWVWDGRSFEGAHVLVRCYHGLGDTIQFARFVPALAARARSVTLEAQGRLLPLLGGLGGLGGLGVSLRAFDLDAPAPPAECDLEISELPGALRIAPDAVPVPYLSWPPAALPAGTVGLCATAGDWDADRSVPEALLRPLAEAHPCVVLTPGPSALPCLNPQGCPFDMEATAALVAGCAAVVTADTMIAHLGGALGRPVLLLLKHEPDWRWDPAARTTRWYPRTRLYRQASPGDWSVPLADAARDLAAMPA